MKTTLSVVLVLIVALLSGQPALADGIIIIDPPPEPQPTWEPWLTIRYHKVTITIKDQVVTTQVDQVFRNDGEFEAEGTYIFPLPRGAMVQNFVMWIDGTPVEGEILSADEARKIYEDHTRHQRDPALLEYVGRDTVRARIFPIPPQREQRIQLVYTQILPLENELMHYQYPLNTERFSAQPLEQVSIHVSIESKSNLRTLYSPTHQDEIMIQQENEHQANVSYEAKHILPNRDFELYVGTSPNEIGLNLLTYQQGAEDGFFLLFLSPSIEESTSPTLARDIFVVLDTSGSMEGEKLDQAQQALVYILQHLNPEDRFNIITFSSVARAYAPKPRPSLDAEAAIDWVSNLEALGGTNISQGLSEAFSQADQERPTVIIFLTDGLPTEGTVEDQALLDVIAEQASERTRIFPFGLGYDVNTLLLDHIAQNHGGSSAYVEPHERIDERVSTFYTRIQSPVLTDISLNFGEVQTYDLYPPQLPDLYAGMQLIVAGRYIGSGPQTIELTGEVNAQPKVITHVGDFSNEDGADFIPRLWAARKIGHLLTQIRLSGEQAEWVDAVVNLSLQYGIITPYTSFLIDETEEFFSTEGRKRATEAFKAQEPLAASGENAVEDAKLRQGLGGAAVPPTVEAPVPNMGTQTDPDSGQNIPNQGTSNVRHVGDKAFICDAQRCTDTSYIPNTMLPHEIVFLSEAYTALIRKHPEWGNYFALAPETIFVGTDGEAYHFFLDTQDNPTQSSAPTMTPERRSTATVDQKSTTNAKPTPNKTDPPAPNPLPKIGVCSSAWIVILLSAFAILRWQRQ